MDFGEEVVVLIVVEEVGLGWVVVGLVVSLVEGKVEVDRMAGEEIEDEVEEKAIEDDALDASAKEELDFGCTAAAFLSSAAAPVATETLEAVAEDVVVGTGGNDTKSIGLDPSEGSPESGGRSVETALLGVMDGPLPLEESNECVPLARIEPDSEIEGFATDDIEVEDTAPEFEFEDAASKAVEDIDGLPVGVGTKEDPDEPPKEPVAPAVKGAGRVSGSPVIWLLLAPAEAEADTNPSVADNDTPFAPVSARDDPKAGDDITAPPDAAKDCDADGSAGTLVAFTVPRSPGMLRGKHIDPSGFEISNNVFAQDGLDVSSSLPMEASISRSIAISTSLSSLTPV